MTFPPCLHVPMSICVPPPRSPNRFSLVVASAGFHVLSFEPLPRNELIMRSSICLLGLQNRITFINRGLGAASEACKIYSQAVRSARTACTSMHACAPQAHRHGSACMAGNTLSQIQALSACQPEQLFGTQRSGSTVLSGGLGWLGARVTCLVGGHFCVEGCWMGWGALCRWPWFAGPED